jgi:hypothetical protein
MGHFRNYLREGKVWRGVPSKQYTGFRFYDTTGKFEDVRKVGRFIHLYRHARGSIHFHARRHFLDDVVQPLAGLGVKCQVRRVKVDGHYAEVFEVSRGPVAVLVVIRNWVNPVFEKEISHVARVLEQYARAVHLEGRFNRIYQCLIAPSLACGQTSLDRLHIRFLSIGYIVLPSMVERIVRQAGVDYAYAFPSQGYWSEGEIDRLRGELLRLLQTEVTAALDATEYTRTLEPGFLRAPTPSLDTASQPVSGSDFAPTPYLFSSHIDPIREKASKSSLLPTSGLDPPCARRFPSSNPSRPVSFPSVLKRTASTSPPTLGEEEEAQLKVWVRDARTITNRHYRINFVRCLIIRNLALQRSPPHITALIRALIRKAWGLNRRTAQEYCDIAYCMLHDNDETYKIRNVTNTRRKRIKHLYLKLIWDKSIQANPSKLIPYAMRLWGVRRRTAWEYEQAAWTAFNRRGEDFLDEAPASRLKTTYHSIYLSDLAQNNPDLAQEPIKLAKIAMRVWGIQRRTADGLTRRVSAMLREGSP